MHILNKSMHQISHSIPRHTLGPLVSVGVLIGIIGSIVKFGWEVPFPARTPLRNITNPPQELLQQLGVPYDVTHATYTFNGNEMPGLSILVHFGFTIFFGILYTLAAEVWPKIKLWQGAAYGIAIWVGFHVVLLPLLGTVPTPFSWVPDSQPWAEHLSEIGGHAFTFWVMELVRQDLKLRIMGKKQGISEPVRIQKEEVPAAPQSQADLVG